jgi:hypothetical protein
MRQTTLRLDESVYRAAKADAARLGMTLTRYMEEALRARLAAWKQESSRTVELLKEETSGEAVPDSEEIERRDALMEQLLRRMSRFQMGPKATREEMNER